MRLAIAISQDMRIPITINELVVDAKLPPGLARISHDELVLVEMQGALEVECNEPGERDGKLVGKLTINEETQKQTLRIGHHLLEGKITTLSKPLAVLTRRPLAASFEGGTAGWDVVAVVKRKIVFVKRPMPIVNHVRQLVAT